MIFSRPKAARSPGGHTGINDGTGDNLLKEINVDCARAREGKEFTARPKELQSVEIDVLVGCLLYTSDAADE